MSKMDKYTAPRTVVSGVTKEDEIDSSGIEKLRTVESWYETNSKMKQCWFLENH